jgi:hypothetical protein
MTVDPAPIVMSTVSARDPDTINKDPLLGDMMKGLPKVICAVSSLGPVPGRLNVHGVEGLRLDFRQTWIEDHFQNP